MDTIEINLQLARYFQTGKKSNPFFDTGIWEGTTLRTTETVAPGSTRVTAAVHEA